MSLEDFKRPPWRCCRGLLAAGLDDGSERPVLRGAAAAVVVPLQVTGPAASRFNLVVMGDGYTAAELPKFREQVDKHLNMLWSIEPFKSYRNYFNVYAVEIASPQSGVDCDPTSPRRRSTPRCRWASGAAATRPASSACSRSARRPPPQYADLVPGTTLREPPDSCHRQQRHVRRRRRHLRHRLRRQRPVGLDHPARARPLARRPAGRIRLLRPRRPRSAVRGRRTRLDPPHLAHRAADAGPADEVVPLAGRPVASPAARSAATRAGCTPAPGSGGRAATR